MPTTDFARNIHAVDLFCGIGGLTNGLNASGIHVKAGFDVDKTCRYAYEANNPTSQFVLVDIRNLNGERLAPYYEGADVTALVGCAPCQPFSSHNLNRRAKNELTGDCSLLYDFGRIIGECVPDLVSMENVPGLVKHQAFGDFLNKLHKLGYGIKYDVLQCADYGVPQKRRRLVLLASRLGEISLPQPTADRKTVADFIYNLPHIEDGQAHSGDIAHTSMRLSDMNKMRIRQSRQGGTWRDWDPSIVSDCHRKVNFSSSYGRMRWDTQAPTITTQFCYYSTGRFGHPEQDRAISVREAALLQTFPPGYQFAEQGEQVKITTAARHIGNAVPVKIAQAIGKSLREAANVKR